MRGLAGRLRYLLLSTRGLVLLAIGFVALVTVVWSTLSGPMVEWGVKDFVVRVLGMRLVEAEREGRIITLYHAIAFPVVAVLVYLMTDSLPMRPQQAATINGTITAGYLTASVSGMIFAYFGRNWVLHGLFVAGQALIFYAGVLLALALWPWQPCYRVTDPARARTRGGVDLERVAFFTMTVATLGSAALGAVAGSHFGNGFKSFLAEDLVREPVKTFLQKAVIGHLHIMLTLIAIATALLIGRWFGFRGVFHRIAMPLMILGTVVVTLGAWSVVITPHAHAIIYVGSVLVMLAALMLVIFGWSKLVQEGLARVGPRAGRPRPGQRLWALIHDPLRFGALWQMVYMNFTVSGVGIFMAIKLDEIFRVWPHREERILLTGHWHILSALIATILLLYFADMMGVRGVARQVYGWTIVLGSNLAFGAVTVFGLKRLFVSEYEQQRLVAATLLLADIGLAAVLVALAAFLIWRLQDLFRRRGMWAGELEAQEPGEGGYR
ncbi:hypothetical protein [Caldinitratiruptor microaerophilus]|uniref:Uncharacterized protein n=1 Tax=Caldinitratiruptor microaerophilus TaxID=671077 RepID=A0AA35CNK2_9FIRM|nr:hypothetical protein [Caldinitratiruptor microaerophilus]BDG61693.1 hypothetical protein caldi_27830 [Caldinitratiruptor microaerophilus]